MVKQCEGCGVEFEAKRVSKKYCTRKCYYSAYWQRPEVKAKARAKARRLPKVA